MGRLLTTVADSSFPSDFIYVHWQPCAFLRESCKTFDQVLVGEMPFMSSQGLSELASPKGDVVNVRQFGKWRDQSTTQLANDVAAVDS
ncbi:MAG: hypothetical protein A2W72_21090 [Burkholderiales bacterium RIFCSPLOWO2_12_67_14]|nr:MAG: hypothetical protein A3I64_17095 [Burkholderiales bacterium RIFCSPLOWO2_02_FULL_67_64]OGB43542.1 MAG: hypothetical protein A3E51_09190 [Burkholderiales bacterium RIFCSPHIGHO2_12_FULL_67_38]OGB44492.1 MAG: hypothetical protein A2W72_21090 [Burkholderiales bacterium RIFCSPLOWO2_12_67_14]